MDDRQVARNDRSGAGPAVVIWAAALIAGAAILGGASRENPLRLAAVELIALPLAVLALRHLARQRPWRAPIFPLIILGLTIAVPLVQLVPMPPEAWMALPGQSPRVEALALAGLSAPWLPISLAPRETLASALALIPPAAMFLAALHLRPRDIRRLAAGWIALAVVGLLLGVAQMAEPHGGAAYLYRTTNLGSMVGLFANRNHEAGFLLALLPFAAALAAGGAGQSRSGRDTGLPTGAPWFAGLFFALAIVGLGVIRSRAGVILAAPTLLACLAVLWRERASRWRGALMGGFAILGVASVVAVALFALTPIADRFAGQASPEFRFEAWPYVVGAAKPFLPMGAGVGAFDRVFRAAEPLNLVGPAYFNHAHNDYLELWLEAGWIGAAVLAIFLVWLAGATRAAWASGGDLFARAASVAIVVMLAQSAVDYPLRTETLASLFAFSCGILAARRRGLPPEASARP